MANVLGIIRNKASGIAGAVELFIDNVKSNDYKKCYLNGYRYNMNSSINIPYADGFFSVVNYNGDIHLLGGRDYRKNHYKWGKNDTSWTSVSTLPYDFYQGSAVVLNNEIHILGGSSYYTRHYKWNGSSWTSVSTLPYNFSGGCAVVLNNEIHILGASSTTSISKNHYKWNGSSWTSVSTLPYSFYSGGAVVCNNEIHILGGYSNENKHYKWNGSSWTSVSTLPYSFFRTQNGAVMAYDNIYLLEGKANYMYFVDAGEWIKLKNSTFDHSSGRLVFYNGEIHLLGGFENSSAINKHEFYLPIVSAKLT